MHFLKHMNCSQIYYNFLSFALNSHIVIAIFSSEDLLSQTVDTAEADPEKEPMQCSFLSLTK